ncbi:hypothetical protein LJT99_08285 [Lentisphaerae bacterium WC36]|nr:hypothetical protein LJT99_08285 [Lentisphaerae bacterium WC36]
MKLNKITQLTGLSRPCINRILKATRQRIAEFCKNESPFDAGEIDENYFGACRVHGVRSWKTHRF